MPVKKITKNTADAQWMTQNLKSVILKRQRAFARYRGNSRIFKFFRNAVNRDRKVCKLRYYESRVQQVKGANPKGWWREVKKLSGMQSYTRDLLSQLNVPEIESLSMHGKANAINAALFEPLSENFKSIFNRLRDLAGISCLYDEEYIVSRTTSSYSMETSGNMSSAEEKIHGKSPKRPETNTISFMYLEGR